MRAMILAAGRGERMGALTSTTPKPLLRVGEKYMIEYALANLKQAGIHEIVINISYQAEQIKTALGDGSRYGVNIFYSEEKERLETGGGIFQALPQLGPEPFLVVSSDVITQYPLKQLTLHRLKSLAHLVLVDNPSFHPRGDFGLRDGYVAMDAEPRMTFGNIGIYHPDIFATSTPGFFPLNKILFAAIDKQQITGEHFIGAWFNIGTPTQLEEANLLLTANTAP